MELFDRYWKLQVKARDNSFDIIISPDKFGNTLRVAFEINATDNLQYYTGEIKIWNVQETKRKALVFNLLGQDFGSGPVVQLTAGYKQKNGLIFNGAVTRGYTTREPQTGDWITTLQVGLPVTFSKKITVPQQKMTSSSDVLPFLKFVVDKTVFQDDKIPIAFAPGYAANFEAAVNDYFASGNTLNEMMGYSGTASQILSEMSNRFNLSIFQDHNGLNVVGKKFSSNSRAGQPVTLPDATTVPELTISANTGLIGSPTYTDTGAKLISYLRPELRMFQYIKVDSAILNKNVSILSMIHRGDSMTNEWYTEVDGSNINATIK